MSATRPALALIGLGVRLPGADTPDALWRALREARRDAFGDRLPDEEPSIKASYGVPPVQRRSLARLQLLMLQVADDALADARLLGEGTDHARTDVICGTCAGFDRTYANAMRVASTRAIDLWLDRRTAAGLAPADPDGLRNRLRQSLRRRYGASPYDRVGEMASTIPARISMAFGLRGRAMAVEALDGTGFAAVEIAARNLRLGRCDTALVVVGQRIEGEWLPRALGAKWLISDPPGAPLALGGRGFRLGEGIIGLVLRRHADAQSAGQRVIATLDGFGRGHDSRRGSFRYPTAVDVRADALRTACAEAGIAPAGLGYVECFGSGIGTEERLELDGLLEAGVGPTAIGSSKWVFGHTFAASGLLGIAKMALALRARELPAEVLGGVDGEAVAPFRRPEAPEPWPADRRHAAVLGSGLDGSAYAVVLGAARAASPITAAPSVEPIALVSYGGRFAQADNAQRFWENIAHGRDLIGPLPESVLPARTFVRAQGVDMLSSYTAVGTCLTPPEAPPDGVKMPRKRWLALDAAQRHALHAGAELFARRARDGRPPPPGRGMVVVASSLCLDAERRSLVRERIGDIRDALLDDEGRAAWTPAQLDELLGGLDAALAPGTDPMSLFTLDGCVASGIAAHLAHEFDLAATPMVVEAACASSLAALDVSVSALRANECDYVVTGGVELPANARDMVLCAALGLLSRDRITPFAAEADGFSIGDGAALFLLRRLEDARRDGDKVYAVIRGIGAACDARSLIAPDVEGQALAIRRAFAEVPYAPSTVDFVETHGTGTTLGDQIEVLSLALTYGDERRATPLVLGSVKSMIGHTFAAAGAAGLLKTVLALGARVLPPNVAFDPLNPHLALPQVPARVLGTPELWPQSSHPRRAGVSAFGTGGINYHVLIEEPEAP